MAAATKLATRSQEVLKIARSSRRHAKAHKQLATQHSQQPGTMPAATQRAMPSAEELKDSATQRVEEFKASVTARVEELKALVTARVEELKRYSTRPPFLVGEKKLYLPNIALTLLRTRHLGPKYAKFEVPLWFSKLDLRDYLFHAYGVRTLSARSYVKMRPVQFGKPLGPRGDAAETKVPRWFRPTSLKYMTVELESPFIWPEAPKDPKPWQRDMHLEQEKEDKENQLKYGSLKDTYIDKKNRKELKKQYHEIMNGTRKWEPPSDYNNAPVLTR